MQRPMFEAPTRESPIYLLIRGDKFVLSGNSCAAKIFMSVEHFNWWRRRYPTQILPTDKLVKYVPAHEED